MSDRPGQEDSARRDPLATTPERVRLDIAGLITSHHGDVYRYAYRLTGNQMDAEDLTQQTFLIAQRQLGQLRESGKAGSWLFTILRNCYLKSRSKRQPVAAASLELDVESIPEDVTEDEIDHQQLQAAIDGLPDDFKLVLVMFYFQECSYKEIAAQLGISIGTVMSRLARAKGRLRQRLLADDSEVGPQAARLPGQDPRRRPAWPSSAADHRPPVAPVKGDL